MGRRLEQMDADKLRFKHQELTRKIIGVFYEVYNELGHGFLESVYEAAMLIALREAGLKAEAQVPIAVYFRGNRVGDFRADLMVENAILLELKAARALDSSHEAQLLNYLRATEIEVGLLLNFGTKPEFKRLAYDNESESCDHFRKFAPHRGEPRLRGSTGIGEIVGRGRVRCLQRWVSGINGSLSARRSRSRRPHHRRHLRDLACQGESVDCGGGSLQVLSRTPHDAARARRRLRCPPGGNRHFGGIGVGVGDDEQGPPLRDCGR